MQTIKIIRKGALDITLILNDDASIIEEIALLEADGYFKDAPFVKAIIVSNFD